ncbi:Methionine import ATP-binding protein MetN [Urinicoccus massiliensis]|uniref:Methionine import ATP-binding protein MetN n=1 Tax=Urinicoccus massiliensis TaxID=1723382 RepID=A0A8H2MF08_9FIRM|nr:hypothetical protein [Urinicoccus massiliensis]VFB16445.1 Methionine import ATP-binding protein MetN [Urinicoccus massiliensis]
MGAIVINDITKRSGRKRILDQVNLEVLEGEFFSILSMEEEAKDALAKILFNFKKPSSGHASIYNFDVNKQSKDVKSYTSFISKEALFPENLKRKAIFKKTLNFHDLELPEDYDELMDSFDCQENLKVANMDERERRMTSIVNALLVHPRVLIVQDATRGMNPIDCENFLSRLKDLQVRENLTILFLSDDLSIAQRYSDRIAYLHEGRIRDIEYLKDKQSKDKLLKVYSAKLRKEEFFRIGARPVDRNYTEATFYYDGYLPDLTNLLYQQGIEDFNLEDALLQDKIDAYYGLQGNMDYRQEVSPSEQNQEVQDKVEEENLEADLPEEKSPDEIFFGEDNGDFTETKEIEKINLVDQDREENQVEDTKVIDKNDLLNQLENGNDKGGFNQ